MNKSLRVLLVVVAAVLLAAFTGITTYAVSQPVSETVTLIQAPPTVVEHPSVEAGNTGHAAYFEASLTLPDGSDAGVLSGKTELIDVNPDGVGEENRYRTLVFQLADGQIVVGGVSGYAPGVAIGSGALIKADGENLPELAVLGGTGVFASVTGYVTSEERSDRTYVHTLVLTQKR
jgi:hypothetical protein